MTRIVMPIIMPMKVLVSPYGSNEGADCSSLGKGKGSTGDAMIGGVDHVLVDHSYIGMLRSRCGATAQWGSPHQLDKGELIQPIDEGNVSRMGTEEVRVAIWPVDHVSGDRCSCDRLSAGALVASGGKSSPVRR